MAVSNWSTTSSLNVESTGISGTGGGVSIAEGMAPSNMNNAMRDFMAQIATFITSATYTGTTPLTLTSTDAGAAVGPGLVLYRNSASPAANDLIGYIDFQGEDSAGNTQTYAQIDVRIDDPTSTTEDGTIRFRTEVAGTLTTTVLMDGAAITPGANDGTALGNTSLMWSDLFLASGGVVNWNAGDVTATHSANLLAFAGATSGYTFDTNVVTGHTAALAIGGNTAAVEAFGSAGVTGRLALGTFSTTDSDQSAIDFYKSGSNTIGAATVVVSGESLGQINWYAAQQTGTFSTQTRAARIRAEVDGTVTSGAGGDMPGNLIFSTTADGGSDVTDRLKIDSGGNFLFQQTTTSTPGNGNNTVGVGMNAGTVYASSAGTSGSFNRTADGNVINILSGGTSQGLVSVSGATVTYGAFFGSHWSQLADGSKPDILRGTVVETIDQMCAWPDEAPEERLPCFKISDMSASSRVYGVFAWWDDKDGGVTNDAFIGSLGAYVVRIAPGVNVQNGDYLESNGDGCARAQSDGLLRASTIAKVTASVVVETYPDGSYLVPATLHCG